MKNRQAVLHEHLKIEYGLDDSVFKYIDKEENKREELERDSINFVKEKLGLVFKTKKEIVSYFENEFLISIESLPLDIEDSIRLAYYSIGTNNLWLIKPTEKVHIKHIGYTIRSKYDIMKLYHLKEKDLCALCIKYVCDIDTVLTYLELTENNKNTLLTDENTILTYINKEVGASYSSLQEFKDYLISIGNDTEIFDELGYHLYTQVFKLTNKRPRLRWVLSTNDTIKINLDGLNFNMRSRLFKYLEVNNNSFCKALDNYNGDDKKTFEYLLNVKNVKEEKKKEVVIEGVLYKDIKSACKTLKIAVKDYEEALKMGYNGKGLFDIIATIRLKKKVVSVKEEDTPVVFPITVDGLKFNTFLDFKKYYNITDKMYRDWQKSGKDFNYLINVYTLKVWVRGYKCLTVNDVSRVLGITMTDALDIKYKLSKKQIEKKYTFGKVHKEPLYMSKISR